MFKADHTGVFIHLHIYREIRQNTLWMQQKLISPTLSKNFTAANPGLTPLISANLPAHNLPCTLLSALAY